MGEVYRARDEILERDVAIKVLPANVAGDPERLVRLQREAQLLAQLDHPAIAAIYGIEKQRTEDGDELRFLVMQLAAGDTLAEILDAGVASPGRCRSLEKRFRFRRPARGARCADRAPHRRADRRRFGSRA